IFSIIITELSLPIGVRCEELTAVKDEESSLEGSTVTLTYNYIRQVAVNDYFFWYRQHPGKPPEFLIFHLGTQNATEAGLSATVSGDKNQITLKISSAAVTDSAVYYCAVRPTVTGNSKTLNKNLWNTNMRQERLSNK
uniref:Ig-like domain-containing protein n=1 Tax=Stegastes partitus TaxID=144197 RepID=A0A3B5A2P6_9TELE